MPTQQKMPPTVVALNNPVADQKTGAGNGRAGVQDGADVVELTRLA